MEDEVNSTVGCIISSSLIMIVWLAALAQALPRDVCL